MIKVTVHEELLPHGVTVEAIYEAITVENVEQGNDPGGLDTLIDEMVDGLSNTILDQQVNIIDANIDLRAQIAALTVERDALQSDFETAHGDNIRLVKERDEARTAANAATENARLLAALNIVTPALETAMGMLSDDDAMPFVRTLGYCILLLEEKAAPPNILRVNELRDDLDEIVMLLQDFEHSDDYTARGAASALLSQSINTFNGSPDGDESDATKRAQSGADTPSETE